MLHKGPVANVQVFGVALADGPVYEATVNASGRTGLNITTVVKAAPGCRGAIRQRTCTLIQATVAYDVRLTNDSIALRDASGSLNASSSAANINNSSTSSTSVPPDDGTAAGPWQPKVDAFVADTRPGLFDSLVWMMLFPMIAPPLQVNLTHNALAGYLEFVRYIDCGGRHWYERTSNTTCKSDEMLRRDLSLECAIQPYNLIPLPEFLDPNENESSEFEERIRKYVQGNYQAMCAIHWHDPMPVCKTEMLNECSFPRVTSLLHPSIIIQRHLPAKHLCNLNLTQATRRLNYILFCPLSL
jgi:hypothetical protein